MKYHLYFPKLYSQEVILNLVPSITTIQKEFFFIVNAYCHNFANGSVLFVFTEKKIFECPICKAVFDQILALKEHVHIHSENGLFTCPQCNKVSFISLARYV